ncbi:MAG: DUF6378 domain-containing protein [Lachnospiraceae bacterium]|jgi:hypothetical protein
MNKPFDREAWEPCGECAPNCWNCVDSEADEDTYPMTCQCCVNHNQYRPRFKFCSECGRPLTPEAWEELEKRVGDGKDVAEAIEELLKYKEAAEIMGAIPLDGPDAVAKSERERILNEAKRCVCGDRDQQYGSPENSFKAIASMWAGYLEAKGCVFPNGEELSAKDAAAMMVLFKMARVATGQTKADNWIDAAGYAACGGEIESSKENQQEDEDDEN